MLYQQKPGAMLVLNRLRELAMQDDFLGMYYVCGLSKGHGHLLPVDETLKVVSYPDPSDWSEGYSLEVLSWCTDSSSSTLEKRLPDIASRKDDDRFIITNVMNEWAEGMTLEPTTVHGRHFWE
eukprot:3715964-Ditylum_brightwellii.AAC.1